MEVFRVWFTGVMNIFGNFQRENQRINDAHQSSTRLKAIKNLSLPSAAEEGSSVHKSVIDKTREVTNIYQTVSRCDITHNRLEALSARLEERQA